MAGKFIVIEGMDGAGKTTQTELLRNCFAKHNYLSTTTREPCKGEIGDLIGEILSGRLNYYRDSLTWLFMADRDNHLRNTVIPSLNREISFISDRYALSTMAYQSERGDLSIQDLYQLHVNSHFLQPDLLIYLDIPTEIAVQRLSEKNHKEVFENQEFLQKLHGRYLLSLELLKASGWRILEVDGLQKPEIITEIIWEEIEKLF